MTDTQNDTTPSDDEVSGPPVGELVDSIPSTSRNGHWATEAEWFVENPRKIKVYKDVSQTTASYLRGQHGLDAVSRNTRKVPKVDDAGKPVMKNGKQVKSVRVDLYVRYLPEKAEAIKAGAKSKANKSGSNSGSNGNATPAEKPATSASKAAPAKS